MDEKKLTVEFDEMKVRLEKVVNNTEKTAQRLKEIEDLLTEIRDAVKK